MKTLSAYVRTAPLTTAELLAFALAFSDRLALDHATDVSHGDLHPENILWDGDQTVEFAERGEDSSDVGYLAPEQCGAPGELGPRSDVFAAGTILYEAATGEHPFADPTSHDDTAWIANIRSYTPRPPGHIRSELAVEWDGILACCLHKEANQRFASALDLHAQIRRLQVSGGTPRKNPFQPRWGRIVAAAMLVVGTLGALVWWLV